MKKEKKEKSKEKHIEKYDRRKKIDNLEFIDKLGDRAWPAVEYLFPKSKKSSKYSDKEIFKDILFHIMLYSIKFKGLISYNTDEDIVKKKLKYWEKIRIWEDVWDIITQFFLVEIKLSPIHGRGVFAQTYIPSYISFLEYCGPRYKEYDFLYKFYNDEKKIKYALRNGNKIIDGDNPKNLARFINHSCDPNCTFIIHKRYKGVWVTSIKPIPKGKEITIRYSYGLKGYEQRPCNCGSPNCLGYIISSADVEKFKKLEEEKKKKQES